MLKKTLWGVLLALAIPIQVSASKLGSLPSAQQVLIHQFRNQSNKLSAELKREIMRISKGVDAQAALIRGNVQEIVWLLRDAELFEASTELENLLADVISTDQIIAQSKLRRGISGAHLVQFRSGLRGVFKTSNSNKGRYQAEVALARLDQLIATDVFPLTVIRNVDNTEGSMQLFIESALSAYEVAVQRAKQAGLLHSSSSPTEEEVTKLLDDYGSIVFPSPSKNIRTLRLFGFDLDARNYSNYLLPIEGRMVAIDGGLAFDLKTAEMTIAWHTSKTAECCRDKDFVAKLKKITPQQIEEALQPLATADEHSKIVQLLYALIEKY